MKLEELSGFDVEDALHRLRGNRSLYTKLLRDLSVRHGGDGGRIREALAAKDYEVARQVAHQLKGVAGNLSASELHAAAGELVLALDADGSVAERHFARLDESLEQAVRCIDSLSEGASGADGASPSGGVDEADLNGSLRAELARSLREAIGLGDVESVECAVERLPEGSRQRAELQELVDTYDFAGVESFAARLERSG